MGGVVKIGRMFALECWCCGCKSRPAADEPTAARWAHLGHWDTPGQLDDGTSYEGYFRCPRCVDLNRWPLETQGWQRADMQADMQGPHWSLTDGPTIRLADGDQAADVTLDAMPDALVG